MNRRLGVKGSNITEKDAGAIWPEALKELFETPTRSNQVTVLPECPLLRARQLGHVLANSPGASHESHPAFPPVSHLLTRARTNSHFLVFLTVPPRRAILLFFYANCWLPARFFQPSALVQSLLTSTAHSAALCSVQQFAHPSTFPFMWTKTKEGRASTVQYCEIRGARELRMRWAQWRSLHSSLILHET